MSNLGTRGKWAEKQVQDWMTPRSDNDIRFSFHRLPDARAARGALSSQPADYYVMHKGEFTHLEVKETEHPLRLPRTKVSQYGVLKKFYLAGGKTNLVVYRSLADSWTYFTTDEIFRDNADPPTSFVFVVGRDFPTAAAVLNLLYPK